MTRTTTSISELTDNFARPHNESGGNGLRVLPLGDVHNVASAAALNSSVNDMVRWMRFQLGRGQFEGKQIISRKQVWEMWQPFTVMQISERAAHHTPSRHFQAYGLGFFLHDFHGRKVVSHGGGLPGMISQLAMIPEEGLGVIVLTNSESPASSLLRDRVLECFLGVEDPADRSAMAMAAQAEADQAAAATREEENAARTNGTSPTLPLQDYAGIYRCRMYGDVTIELEGDQLVLRMLPAKTLVADLAHWHYNRFQLKWRESVPYDFSRGFVNFTISGDGRPDRLVIDQPNNDFWFDELDLRRVDD